MPNDSAFLGFVSRLKLIIGKDTKLQIQVIEIWLDFLSNNVEKSQSLNMTKYAFYRRIDADRAVSDMLKSYASFLRRGKLIRMQIIPLYREQIIKFQVAKVIKRWHI